MIDSLQPPADLGAARARLRHQAVSEAAIDGRAITYLRPGDHPDVPPGAGVVVADMVLWQVAPADLRTMATALDRRVLLFLEPTAELGWRRLVHRVGRRWWRRRLGHHFECDVPAELRAAGLAVTEIDRFGVGPRQVRSYVLGRAEHIRN